MLLFISIYMLTETTLIFDLVTTPVFLCLNLCQFVEFIIIIIIGVKGIFQNRAS